MRKVRGKLLIIFAVILLAAATALGVTLAVRRGGVTTSYAADSAFSVGAEGYDDFASAMDAAKATSSAMQRTVTMNSDYTLSTIYTLGEGYYATLDLNGHTLDCSSLANAIDVYGTLTLRDGTDAYGTTTSKNVGVSRTSSGTKPYRTIYSSSMFTGSESNGLYDGSTSQSYEYYDSGAIIGCREGGSSYAYYDAGTVRVLGGGTFNMYGGTITGANAYFGGAVNVCGTDASGASSSPVFNMYGGSVSGNTSTSSAAGILVSGGGEANLAGGIIAHNECTVSSGGGAGVTATDPGSTVSLGEYKTGLDIKTPLIISGGSAGYGAGVSVWDGAAMYMYDGAEISNNVSTGSSSGGGAVAVSGAAMYMYGGKIIDNTAVNKGGAVYITGGTFVMSGGEVSFNGVSTSAYGYGSQPAYGGSFYVSGTFEMTGGSILSSVADTYGGAIYVDKSSLASMSGGTIMGCASYSGGGAVYVVGTGEFDMSGTADITLNSTSGTCGAGVFVEKDATFDMSGGTIEKGVIIMSSYGGVGVYVDGTFVMTGGAIKDNSFTLMSGIGGGVYLSGSGTMYMYGGVVTGNSALTYAGGIYAAGSLHVMGEVTVSGNTCGSADSNIYLINNIYVTLDGAVTSGSELGITFASSSQTQVTAAETFTTYYRQSYFYFSMDVSSSGYMMGYSSGAYVEKILSSSLPFYVSVGGTAQYCIALEDAIYLSSETGSPVILASSATVYETVTVEKGTSATMDLSGHTLTFSGQYTRLEIYGTLTITDSTAKTEKVSSGASGCKSNGDGTYTTTYATASESGEAVWNSYTSGAITTDGNYTRYGYIDVFGGGTLNLEDGSICCTQNFYLAVLYMQGTSSSHAAFNMTGGSLSGNTSTNYYGAIYGEYSDVRITGGVSAANTAGTSAVAAIGGDCVIEIGGTAVISGNTGAYIIYVTNGADLMVSDGAEISFNEINSTKSTAGVIAVSAATFKLSGGMVAYNAVTEYGAVNVDAESGDATVLVSGTATVYHNYVSGSSATQSNIYLRSGDETISIESGFSGVIGVTKAAGNTERIAINSANLSQSEVESHIFSDESRECVCASDDGYIYFHESHEIGGLRIEADSSGKLNAWYVCGLCGSDIGQYLGNFSYGMDDDGTAYVYADGGTYSAELSFGIFVKNVDEYSWYPDVGSLNEAKLSDGESVILLADAEGIMEISAKVTVDLNGHVLGGISVSGGVELKVVDSSGGEGLVYSDVLGYIDWNKYFCYVGTDGTDTYYKVMSNNATVTYACGAVVSYNDGTYDRTIYYENLQTAIAGGVFGETGVEITLYADAEPDDTVNVSAQGVKINLHGHNLTAYITISEGGTLTIWDSAEDGDSFTGIADVTFTISGGTLILCGGTYGIGLFGTSGNIELGTDYRYVLNADSTFTVMTEGDVTRYSRAAVSVGDVTTYYETFEMALKAVLTGGGTITLYDDIEYTDGIAFAGEGFKVTIDLNGHTLALGDKNGLTIYADYGTDGYGEGASLEVTDSSTSRSGMITGTITVEGTHVDVGEQGYDKKDNEVENPYENTLTFTGSVSANSSLTVNLDSLNAADGETHTYYYFASLGDTYGITVTHYHIFNITEWTISPSGEISFIILCSCGQVYGEYDETTGEYGDTAEIFHVNVTDDADNGSNDYMSITDNGDGTVTYSGRVTVGIWEYDETSESTTEKDKKYVFEITITPVAKIIAGSETYYPADEDALIEHIKNNTYTEMTITLWRDMACDLAFSDCKVTLNLGGHTLTGDITLSGGAEVTINFGVEGGMSGDITVEGASVASISLCGGTLDGSVNVYSGAAATVDLGGGTISGGISVGSGRSDTASLTIEDTSYGGSGIVVGAVAVSGGNFEARGGTYLSVDAGFVGYVAQDYSLLCNADGSYTVIVAEEADAEYNAKADAGYGGYIYYESLQDAVSAAAEQSGMVVLLKDVKENIVVSASSSVTLDLNGNTLTGTVTVRSGAYLLVTDSQNGKGTVYGNFTVIGTLEIEAGTYSQNVSRYVVSSYREERVLLAEYSVDKEALLYTVTTKDSAESGESAAASVTTGGVAVYYKEMSHAVAAISGGSTMTLYDNVVGNVEIKSDNVTIDLNGKTLTGSVTVPTSVSGITITVISSAAAGKIAGSIEIGGKSCTLVFGEGTSLVVTGTLSVTGSGSEVNFGEGAVINMEEVSLGGDSVKIDLGGACVTAALTVIGGTAYLDLAGGTWEGNVTATGGSLTISDSTATYSTVDGTYVGMGTGVLKGNLSADGGTLEITAGAFETETDVKTYLDTNLTVVVGNGVAYVVTEELAPSLSAAYSDTTKTYYTSVYAAVMAVAETGGTITLLSDDVMEGTAEIVGAVEIDFNGHTLYANFIIAADEGGKLKIYNSAYDEEELTANLLTGTIIVNGCGGDDDKTNKYEDTLIFTDGIRPTGDVEIDLTDLDGSDCLGYSFGETEYAGSGVYGITTGYTHIHNYNIESWTIDYDGRVTLTILCACGEADPETESDDYIAKTVDITAEGDGCFTFEATVIVGEGDDEVTYVCRKTVLFAATVTDAKGKMYYFGTLQEAVDFVAGYDGCTIILQSDVTEIITVPSDDNTDLASVTVTIDLNGKSITGEITVNEGTLTVYGDGYVYGDITADGGVICLRGGSYTSGNVSSFVDAKGGYAVLYTADELYVVVTESYAQGYAAASVTTSDGTVSYCENLGDAVSGLTDGATLTLYSDASGTYIEIRASGVTVGLNGHDVGEIYIAESGFATIVGEGFVDTLNAGTGSLCVAGGSYDDEAAVFAFLAEGYVAVLGSGGVYRVVSAVDALSFAAASVVTESGGTLYFDALQSALDYANVNGLGTVILVNDSEGDIEIDGDVGLDLNGNTLCGGIFVSDGISLTITDAGEGGLVTGAIVAAGEMSVVTLSGGSYADDSFLAYLANGQVAYRNADGSFTPMTEEEAEEKCGVCVTYGGDTGAEIKIYCETVEIATEYAAANGGTIILYGDITWSGTLSSGKITIDLAGHTLKAEITIMADFGDELGKGASVGITDSKNTGKVTGTVTVEGAGDGNEDDNSYAGTFVLEGGVTPGGNLTVDLSSLSNSSNGGYFFSKDNSSADVYRIAAASEHTPHEYDIEVWDVDGEGNAVLYFMCACGEYESDAYGDRLSYTGELEIVLSSDTDGVVTYTYTAADVDGKVYLYEETFAYSMCVELDGGKTLYFASVYDALTYTSVHGGTATLTKDVTEDINIWDKGLIIGLNGHILTTSLDILAGASLTICGNGELVCAITSSGTLTLDGNMMTVTLTGDALGTERGRIVLTGNICFNLGGHVFTGAPEITDGTTFTISGGEFCLVGDVTIGVGAKIYVAGGSTIDLNGYALTGDIDIAAGAVLVITDTSSKNTGRYEGTINVPSEAGLEIYRGCIDLSDILGGALVVEIEEPKEFVFASLAQQDGSTYYKVVTKAEHEELGHGYDIQSADWFFDTATSVLTLYFTCLCGEEVTYSFYLSENFYETRVEFYDYEEILPDGSTQSRQVALGVELVYEISSSVVADNGVTYSFSAYGTVDLPGFVEENDGYIEIPEGALYVDDEGNLVLNLEDVKEIKDGVGYRYTCIVEATCSTTGEVIYEYGDGKGVVVRVLSGAYHRGIQRVTSETEGYEDLAGYDDRYEVYYCPKCGKIFVNSSDALDNKGYDDLQDVVDDMDRSDAFEEEKDGVQDQLDETMTGCMGDAGGSVSQSYEKAVEDLDDWEFEFDGGRTDPDKYLQDLMENIEAILEWATLEINKQEYATITEGQITELYENLLRSGLYDETVLRYEYDDIIQCLGELVVESMEVIEEVYTAYLEKSLQDLQNLDLLPGQTLSGDTSEGGTEGEITIEGTVSGLTKFVIYRELINASLDDKIADGELVAANGTLEGDLDSYVDGKKVLAVYSVMLVDTVNDTELALFEGTYTITIKLSSGLVGVEGLQILYVGDDGRVEVYDTTLSEDGQYITFTTTHLSRYVLVGGDETDLTTMIYFLGITLDIEVLAALALLVAFLVIRSKNGSGKKSKKVASFALVALLATVVPAGGIMWTVLLAVGCVVMLAVDMLLVYGILNERRKSSLATEETGEGDGEDAGDKTEKADK